MAVEAVECVDEAEAPMPRVSAYPPEKSHAELVVGSGMWEVRAGCEGRGPSRGLACEGSEVGWAWLRCPWAVAGPGRASSRRAELPNSDPAPLVWRAPEGPEGLVAVPVGGGRARAGLEIDHSEPQARVWRSRGRAAAHRHTERPDRTRQIMRSGRRVGRRPRALRAARPDTTRGARNTSGAT